MSTHGNGGGEGILEHTDVRLRPSIGPGTAIGASYVLGNLLGEGGMGAVYEAVQRPFGRKVAIKVLQEELAASSESVARFEREANLIARVQHPNIVTVHDFGVTEDGLCYIVMERLQGRTLRADLRATGALATARAARIIRQIAAALAEAHRLGIVHRDLKASNVQLVPLGRDPDFVKLLDFGVAKLVHLNDDAPPLTQRGVVGTPQSMAPEQIRGLSIDHRTDLYALGCLFFELVTGRLPFTDTDPAPLFYKHLNVVPPTIREIAPELDFPPELENAIARLLAKNPEDRFASADEVEALLEEWSGRSIPTARDVMRLNSKCALGSDPTTEDVSTAPESLRTAPEPSPALAPRGVRGWQLTLAGLVIIIGVLGGAVVEKYDTREIKAVPLEGEPREVEAQSTNTAGANVERDETEPARPRSPAEAAGTTSNGATLASAHESSLMRADALRKTHDVAEVGIRTIHVQSGSLDDLETRLRAEEATLAHCYRRTQRGRDRQRRLRLTLIFSDGKQSAAVRPIDASSTAFLGCVNDHLPRLMREPRSPSAVAVVTVELGPS